MIYCVEYTKEVDREIAELKKSDTFSYNQLVKLIKELHEHPRFGTGKPELLKQDYAGCYSRRINKKNRLIYRIYDDKVLVLVLSTKGHYGDK